MNNANNYILLAKSNNSMKVLALAEILFHMQMYENI